MITLDELNLLRQHEKWEEVLKETRNHVKTEADCSYAWRALVQALERLDQKEEEYEAALQKLLDIKDRIMETSVKLAQHYREKGQVLDALRHYEKSMEVATADRQYDQIEAIWKEYIELAPDNLTFLLSITDRLHEIKHHQKAAALLKLTIPVTTRRKNWEGQYRLLKKIFAYTPQDDSLRTLFISTLEQMYADSPHFDEILDFSDIRKERNLEEALNDVETFAGFMPNSYVMHSDWGIGKVTDLSMLRKRVTINFQRKRKHQMDVNLARNIVENLKSDDFRVILVTQKDELQRLASDDPLQLVKVLLKSFGRDMSAKEIKEKLCPAVLPAKGWSTWWSKTNSEMRRDPFISVTGGAAKTYTLREQATSDEDELLQRFDETKFPRDKVDMIYEYLRTTKKTDIQDAVIRHFSKRLHTIAPYRKSATEKVEMWYTNEDLKELVPTLESMPEDLLLEVLMDVPKCIQVIKRLRFKNHELRFIKRFQAFHPESWEESFQQKLLEEDIQVRDEIAEFLVRSDRLDLIMTVVETAVSEFRKYPQTFIWLAKKGLMGEVDWLEGKINPPAMIERLLILTDYLTSQAKRREKDESAWLRKVAGEAREIIRRNHYALFKKHIQSADESVAQAIYRRSQTNDGLDGRTSSDLTTIIRARFPTLFETSTIKESLIPEGLQCLKESLVVKQTLLKRLIEIDLPTVVKEIEVARGHGDLKENAEYHAAKDKQKLLASQTSELQDMLQQARAVELDQVKGDEILFGTQFDIKPVGSDVVESYMMLGPWESDPDNNVLSYQAPFAACFIGHMAGELIEIELPRHTGRYEILAVRTIPSENLETVLARIRGDVEIPSFTSPSEPVSISSSGIESN
ncbi:MAG: GreA/GreB family elongation factor [bacterium]|jgi:transcription elongation factor GreA-like protein/transcription elongation GreA/GreB family factor|nr:GreA/GreB family elongation factor [bacterium]